MQKLFPGNYVQISRECNDLFKSQVQQMLDAEALMILKNINDMRAR